MIIEDTNKYTSLDYSKKAIEISSDALASEIILLDLKSINGFTDYFVILTVSSKRQADSLSDKIIKELKLIGCGIINFFLKEIIQSRRKVIKIRDIDNINEI